jgi:hypothetical protein
MDSIDRGGKCKNQKAVAFATGLPLRYVRSILLTAFVAPTIVEAIVEGRQPEDLTLRSLLQNISLSWTQQKHLLGRSQR